MKFKEAGETLGGGGGLHGYSGLFQSLYWIKIFRWKEMLNEGFQSYAYVW